MTAETTRQADQPMVQRGQSILRPALAPFVVRPMAQAGRTVDYQSGGVTLGFTETSVMVFAWRGTRRCNQNSLDAFKKWCHTICRGKAFTMLKRFI